jgi:hypothetical protein
MANPKFLYCDISRVTFTATSEATGYEATKLSDYNPGSRWAAGADTWDQSVYFTFDNASACNMVILENKNFDAVMVSGSIKLQYADDAGFTSNVVTLTTIPTSSATWAYEFPASVTKKYWRIYFNGEVGSTPYLGNWYMGTYLEMTHNYEWGYKIQNYEHKTSEVKGLRGNMRMSSLYAGRVINEITFKYQNDTTKNSWVDFVTRIRGKLFPFYFIDHNENISFVKIDGDYTAMTAMIHGINDLQTLKLKGLRTTSIGSLTSYFEAYGIYEDELITGVS